MKKFLGVFCVFLVLGVAPSVQAQKWQSVKKMLCGPKTKISYFSARSKVEAAVLCAVKSGQIKALPSRAAGGKVLLKTPSLAAFAPAKEDLPSLSAIPAFAFQPNEKEMYRGMALPPDGEDLRFIMQNGLKVSKSHYENFAAYDGRDYPDGTKAIYASFQPKYAVRFIFAEQDWPSYIPVILHLKKLGWRDFVSVPHDIPPSWIYRVSALLKVNGRLTWGELKIKNKEFIFTPYPPAPPAAKE